MDENNNFLDKNTLVAIVLSILFFVGWQSYLQKKYPEAYQPKESIAEDQSPQTDEEKARESKNVGTEVPLGTERNPAPNRETVNETQFRINSENWNLELSSLGMGLNFVELKKYTDRKDKSILFEDPKKQVKSFSTDFNGEPIAFHVEKKGDFHFIGSANINGLALTKEMVFDPKSYTVSVKIKSLSGSAKANDEIQTHLANKVLEVKSSMFVPAYEGTEFFSIDDGSEERERIDITEPYSHKLQKTTLSSIGTQYFALAINDHSPVIPQTLIRYEPASQVAYATMTYPATTQGNKTSIEYTGFVGPKKYDILKNLDSKFVQMINYGMFSVLSKPMLSLLKWLYGLFHNWGIAIILLTIAIRMLLLPINVSSLKSMKKMQKLQPQIKAIKEKYKDDPQRVNQETMALMKKEKANPIGGCLPLLLQLPIFLALYSVLGQSVELYKSPFMFWIQDLSYQDPFFVLPIAVGGLYFVQMSISPQPTDPTQAKVMKFIPLLFCFFMITVPSGLTLYFLVNTLFGIGQSYIFQREKRKAAA
jgi:YidC/Oxa1 family membrane protein insertase